MKLEQLHLPKDWKVGPISDSFDFTSKPRGLDLSKNGDEIPFFPMDQIPLGRIYVSQFTPKPLAKLGSGTYVEKGDLMVAKITPSFENGKQAIVDIASDFAYATTEVIPIRGKKGESDTLFLFFYLLHPEVRSDLAGKMEGSTGRQRLSKTVLGDRLIPLPPLPEQKKIAHILSTVQRAIEAQERIIQTTTELKKALMHKLFTEGLRGEPQKQTEIGPIPESWEVVELGELISVAQYGMSVKGNPEGNYPILRMTNQVNGRIVANNLQFVEITDSDFRRFKVDRGDILFNRTNSLELVGRTAIHDIEGDYVFASYLIRLRTNTERLNPFFLNLDFNRDETQVRLKSIATRAVSQSNISATRLKGFPIPLPNVNDQAEIVRRAAAFDSKIALHQAKLTALQGLFRTLLHELMTAKTRVHKLEITT